MPPIPVAAAEPLIHFESADPFYPDQGIPECVRQAIMEKLDDQSAAHYPPLTGDSGLKETLAKRLNEKYHANVDPERNILVIPGAELGLVAALTAFLQQGDELLIYQIRPTHRTSRQHSCWGQRPSVFLYGRRRILPGLSAILQIV